MSDEFCQDTFSAIKEIMEDEINSVIETYLNNGKKYINNINSGLIDGDYSKIEDAAHPLKSSSATLGLLAMSDTANKIEQLSMADKIEDKCMIELKDAIDLLPDYLKRAHGFLCN